MVPGTTTTISVPESGELVMVSFAPIREALSRIP